MKLKTKHITVTAVMIALSIVVIQFIKAPLMIAGQNVAISGALINLILIIDTLYCGLVSGIILSVIIPVFSFILTQSPLISAVPVILPCIMIGNIVFVLFAWFVRNKKIELNLLPLSLVVGSIAKAGIMTLLIVQWAIPQFGASLAPENGYNGKSYIFYNTVSSSALLVHSYTIIISINRKSCSKRNKIRIFIRQNNNDVSLIADIIFYVFITTVSLSKNTHNYIYFKFKTDSPIFYLYIAWKSVIQSHVVFLILLRRLL
ncbi:MAG: ECF transporter S component [Eubacterium ventriosum]